MRTHLHDREFMALLQTFPKMRYVEYPFPATPLTLFGDEESLKLVAFGLHPKGRGPGGRSGAPTGPIRAAMSWLDAYLAGKEKPMPTLDLSPFTEKQKRVYSALLKVGFGATVSYGGLAELAGLPRAARFVGSCMADNIFPIFIPCHRVVRANGDMGNYSGGVEIKRFLLKHEGAMG